MTNRSDQVGRSTFGSGRQHSQVSWQFSTAVTYISVGTLSTLPIPSVWRRRVETVNYVCQYHVSKNSVKYLLRFRPKKQPSLPLRSRVWFRVIEHTVEAETGESARMTPGRKRAVVGKHASLKRSWMREKSRCMKGNPSNIYIHVLGSPICYRRTRCKPTHVSTAEGTARTPLSCGMVDVVAVVTASWVGSHIRGLVKGRWMVIDVLPT